MRFSPCDETFPGKKQILQSLGPQRTLDPAYTNFAERRPCRRGRRRDSSPQSLGCPTALLGDSIAIAISEGNLFGRC